MLTTTPNKKDSLRLTIPKERLWTLSTIEQLTQTLEEQGWLHLKLTEDAQWMGLATQITKCHLLEQQNGRLFDEVRSVANKEHLPDSQGGAEIPPHTDGPHFLTPPKFLVLWCKTPDQLGQVNTLLADVRELLRWKLTEEDLKILMKPIPFMSKDKKTRIIAPILNFTSSGNVLFRYSQNIILRGDPSPDPHLQDVTPLHNPQLKDICDRISEWFYDNAYSISLDQGSLIFLNNHYFLHGRSKVWDKNRNLERIWLG